MWGDIPRLAPGQAVLKWRMEVSRLTAELPGKEVSFHHVPFIQRARSGPPRPKAVLPCCRDQHSSPLETVSQWQHAEKCHAEPCAEPDSVLVQHL